MPGCSVHSYLISPAFVGVNEYLPPLPNWSEEKSAPESAFTSWSTESWLTHVTFWPTFTVCSFGANWMFCMLIVTAPPAAGAGAGVELEEEPESESELPQPAMARATAPEHRRSRAFMALHLDARAPRAPARGPTAVRVRAPRRRSARTRARARGP